MPEIAAAYVVLAGPWGPIHVAASERGIVAIDIIAPTDVVEADLARRFGTVLRIDEGPAGPGPTIDSAIVSHLAAGRAAVQAHLAGRPDAFDGLRLDLDDRPAWDRAVFGAVRALPWGSTSSYGGIARAIGRAGAARAVGGAVGRNPVSLAIPCHRVIAGDGSIGGYGGGWWGSREARLALKRDLLAREGIVVGTAREARPAR